MLTEIVEEVGKMNISGNVIPSNWYKTITSIKNQKKKPYMTAIIILADIVYWYRPTEIRDEVTGNVTGYRKKFKADLLQRSYQSFSDQFGLTKREVTNAIVFLEKLGVIDRVFRTIHVNGIPHNNVLFINLNVEELKKITYEVPENYRTDNLKKPTSPPTLESDRCPLKKRQALPLKSDSCNLSVRDAPALKSDRSHFLMRDEYKDYNKDYNKDYLSILSGEKIETWFKNKIDYDYLKTMDIDQDLLNDLVQIVCDVLKQDSCLVNGSMKSRKQLISTFEQLNYEYVLYVFDSFQNVTKKIKKPREYIFTCLYNSLQTMGFATVNQVNIDFADGKI